MDLEHLPYFYVMWSCFFMRNNLKYITVLRLKFHALIRTILMILYDAIVNSQGELSRSTTHGFQFNANGPWVDCVTSLCNIRDRNGSACHTKSLSN